MVDLSPKLIRQPLEVGRPQIADPGAEAPAYAEAMTRLLPPGRLWVRAWDSATIFGKLLLGLAREPAILASRGLDLLDRESDPRRTQELLAEWERAAGLPDPCLPGAADEELRRNRLVERLVGDRGQAATHFEALVAGLGYSAEILEFHPFRVGAGEAGTPLYGEGWAHVWFIVADLTQSEGEAATDPTGAAILCILGGLKPAHSVLLVYFGSVPVRTISPTISIGAPISPNVSTLTQP